jgi:chemotaxis protein histidine kinase CheA
MALTNQEVVFTFNAETGDVEKVTTRLAKDMEKVADAADDAAKATEEIGKNAKSAGTGLKKAGTLGAQGFKALGTAIKATGIGLLVGVVVKLTQKMTENKKIAEALEVVFNGLGVVFNVLVEALTPLGDLLISAFTEPQQAVQTLRDNLIALKDYFGTLLDTAINPVYRGLLNLKRGFYEAAIASKEFVGLDASELKQTVREIDEQLADLVVKQEENKEALSEPWKEAAEAIKGYVEEAKGAVTQSTALTKQQQALRDAQRELNVATAEAAAEVEELKRQSDDQRLSVEERIEAATRAAEINQRFADQNVALSQQQADLIRQEIALQGESQERLEALAQAEIEAAAARQASATIQTELQNKLFALNQELIAQEEERLAAEEEARLALEERLAEEQKLKDEAAAKDAERRAKEREEELANAEAIKQARLDITKSTLDALSALNEAFTGESEQEQKKGFERSKKIQTAQALISTYESAVQAFKSLAGIPVVGPGLGTAAAVAATAAGLANVKKIQSQTFQGGGGGGGSSYSGTGGPGPSIAETAAQTPPAPTLDLGFLGEGAQQQVIETYVISENVTSAQQANKKIQDQSTL